MKAVLCVLLVSGLGIAMGESQDVIWNLLQRMAKKELQQRNHQPGKPIFPACVGTDELTYSIVHFSNCINYTVHANGQKEQRNCDEGKAFNFEQCECMSKKFVDPVTCTDEHHPMASCDSPALNSATTKQPLPGCKEFAMVLHEGSGEDRYETCSKGELFDLKTCSCSDSPDVQNDTCSSEVDLEAELQQISVMVGRMILKEIEPFLFGLLRGAEEHKPTNETIPIQEINPTEGMTTATSITNPSITVPPTLGDHSTITLNGTEPTEEPELDTKLSEEAIKVVARMLLNKFL